VNGRGKKHGLETDGPRRRRPVREVRSSLLVNERGEGGKKTAGDDPVLTSNRDETKTLRNQDLIKSFITSLERSKVKMYGYRFLKGKRSSASLKDCKAAKRRNDKPRREVDKNRNLL